MRFGSGAGAQYFATTNSSDASRHDRWRAAVRLVETARGTTDGDSRARIACKPKCSSKDPLASTVRPAHDHGEWKLRLPGKPDVDRGRSVAYSWSGVVA
jgi:hypothetical protein